MLLITPTNDTVSIDYNTSGSIEYIVWDNIYEEGDIDQISIPDPDTGDYRVFVIPDSAATDTSTYSLYSSYNDHIVVLASNEIIYDALDTGFVVYFGVLCSNIDSSGAVNVADLTYLVDYLFFDCPPPPVIEAANVVGQGGINVADLTYLVNYLFFEGPEPICD